MKKEFLSALLALFIVLTFLPLAVSAAGDDGMCSISIDENIVNGTVTADKMTAEPGDTVTLTVTPDDHYDLSSLTYVSAGEDGSADAPIPIVDLNSDGAYQFTMPQSDAIVYASFTEHFYTINNISLNCSYLEIDKETAKFGELVTIQVSTELEGQELTLTINGSVDGLTKVSEHMYTFLMPGVDVTIDVSFPGAYHAILISAGSGQDMRVDIIRNSPQEPDIDGMTAQADDWIYLTAPEGTAFAELSIDGKPVDTACLCLTSHSFFMPSHDVTISASFSKIYNISRSGNIAAYMEQAIEGDLVTFSVVDVPDGQVLDRVTVFGGGTAIEAKSVEGKENQYAFIMPDCDVEINAYFADVYGIVIKGEGVTVSSGAARAGESVTFTVSVPNGQVLDQVAVSNAAGIDIEVNSVEGKENEYIFTMPAGSVTITVAYKDSTGTGGDDSEKPNDAHKVTGPTGTDNGIVKLSAATAKEGAVVTITAVPDAYYAAETPQVKSVSGKHIDVTPGADNTYTFVMPAEDVSVSVTFVYALKLVYTKYADLSNADKALYYGGKLEISGLVPNARYVVTLDNGLAVAGGGIPRSAFVVTADEAGSVTLSCQSIMNVIVFAVKGSNVTTDLEEVYSDGVHAGVPVSTLPSGSAA